MNARLLCVMALVLGCDKNGTGNPPLGAPVRLVQVVAGLSTPVHLTAPTGDPRLFILEKDGRVRIVKDGTLLPTPFLDLDPQVGSGGFEQGLLGLAFHPDYASNGYFYVNYTDNAGDTRVERYEVSAGDPDLATPASAHVIIAYDQPYGNHNAGQLLFGPDGMLYIPTGDGGDGGDPQERAQNLTQLLGKLLRLDVDGGDPYAIPPDNPYVGGGGLPEIWARGLRNPWRITFDAGLLYIADVGQGRFEEVNVRPADVPGLNYGWDIMEGPVCFEPMTGCNQGGLVLPVHSYPRTEGISITGGAVYRGAAHPTLVGHYFYGDYGRGWIRSFRIVSGAAVDHFTRAENLGNITSFGVDAAGELYVLTAAGRVYRIEETPEVP